jgi:hypothetical protein
MKKCLFFVLFFWGALFFVSADPAKQEVYDLFADFDGDSYTQFDVYSRTNSVIGMTFEDHDE